MFYFSVGAIFKNESMVLKEWLDHYIFHGVEHFYLINDNSTDNFMDILKDYRHIVTLFHCDVPRMRGRQSVAYNTYLKPILHETKWLAILDIDEYLYSPNMIHIPDILKKYEMYSLLQLNWVCFGSNGQITQPKSIVESFTKRAEYNKYIFTTTPFGDEWCELSGKKHIINTSYDVKEIHIHYSIIDGIHINISLGGNGDLLVNHYSLMSKEYFEKIKMTRGDADCWHNDTERNLDWFNRYDINDLDDFRLYDQNKCMF